MISKMIAGLTRVCGKSQGYLGLPIRDEVIECTVNGPCPAMTTAWEPTPDELRLLNEGRPVYVRILGRTPPPMYVFVEGEDG